MSRAFNRPCRHRGCSALVAGGGLCPKHVKAEAAEYRQRTKDDPDRRFYSTGWWKKLRDQFLSEHPFCEVCGQAATVADHRVPRRQGGSDEFGNLRALCASHHSAHHTASGERYGNR